MENQGKIEYHDEQITKGYCTMFGLAIVAYPMQYIFSSFK